MYMEFPVTLFEYCTCIISFNLSDYENNYDLRLKLYLVPVTEKQMNQTCTNVSYHFLQVAGLVSHLWHLNQKRKKKKEEIKKKAIKEDLQYTDNQYLYI